MTCWHNFEIAHTPYEGVWGKSFPPAGSKGRALDYMQGAALPALDRQAGSHYFSLIWYYCR